MSETLPQLVERYRATGRRLIQNNPPGSEGEVTGRRYLAWANEVEDARNRHPYAAGLTALALVGSIAAGEVLQENQARQHESDSVVYSLAAPWHEFPAIPTEHVPGQEPEGSEPTTVQVV